MESEGPRDPAYSGTEGEKVRRVPKRGQIGTNSKAWVWLRGSKEATKTS